MKPTSARRQSLVPDWQTVVQAARHVWKNGTAYLASWLCADGQSRYQTVRYSRDRHGGITIRVESHGCNQSGRAVRAVQPLRRGFPQGGSRAGRQAVERPRHGRFSGRAVGPVQPLRESCPPRRGSRAGPSGRCILKNKVAPHGGFLGRAVRRCNRQEKGAPRRGFGQGRQAGATVRKAPARFGQGRQAGARRRSPLTGVQAGPLRLVQSSRESSPPTERFSGRAVRPCNRQKKEVPPLH